MTQEEARDYLAKIRKTLEASQAAIDDASLRIQETDRLLARQGLTREQVLNFKFTREDKLAVNEELRRRGLPPIEEDEEAFDFGAATASLRSVSEETAPYDPGEELAERQRRFGNLMCGFRL